MGLSAFRFRPLSSKETANDDDVDDGQRTLDEPESDVLGAPDVFSPLHATREPHHPRTDIPPQTCLYATLHLTGVASSDPESEAWQSARHVADVIVLPLFKSTRLGTSRFRRPGLRADRDFLQRRACAC